MGKCIFFSLMFFLSCNCPSIAQLPQLPKQVKVGKPEILKPKSGTYKRDDLEKEFQLGSKWGTKKLYQNSGQSEATATGIPFMLRPPEPAPSTPCSPSIKKSSYVRSRETGP